MQKTRKKALLSCLLFLVFLTRAYSTQSQVVKIHSNNQTHTLILDVADTFQKRQKGLMNRKYLSDKKGMLFVFTKMNRHCFWMKNTHIPLDILLINQEGILVEILENMKPYSQKHRCSKTFIQRAIELKGRICHDRGIRIGDSLIFSKNKP